MASYRDYDEGEGVVLGQQERTSSPSSFCTDESTPLLQSPVPELTYAVIDINPRITYTTRGRADTIATSSTDTAVDSNNNIYNDADQEQQYNTSLLEARRKRLKPKIIPLCLGAMFLLELSVALSMPPNNAVEESIICRNLHPDVVSGPTNSTIKTLRLSENPICKDEDVQSYLAMLQGWQATSDCIPSILMTVPFGMLSDKWGRRPVLTLAMLGTMLQMFGLTTILFLPHIFPIWTVWLTSSFLLIGGGGGIITAMLYTFISDIVPIAERATLFFQMHATYLTARMISGPIAGSLMVISPWIPLLLSLGLITLATVLTLVFPETRHLKVSQAPSSSTTSKTKRSDNDDEEIDKPMISPSSAYPPPQPRPQQPAATIGQRLTSTFHSLTNFLSTANNRKICLLTLALALVVIGKYVQALLLQYATKRFGYSWSEASYLLTIPHFTSLITLLVILPFVSSWLLGTSPFPFLASSPSTTSVIPPPPTTTTTRIRMLPLKKDLLLSRASSLLLTTGCLLLALSSTPLLFTSGMVLFALGSGLGSTLRSLLNALVDEQHMGLVNSVVGWLEMVGIMVAGPVLAEGLSEGLKRGGSSSWWMGLPFWMAGGLLAVASGLVWVVRV
ncbi:major facilitator superfamily domain-containing protein [Sordaria brevicollis]|uniref:Major facilitator superfamily domain-containing protein n=1 Tax=Sordaria brevicollis TaxID=83679 RepID=A0AAE0PA47_SORBR|nr:major facilitator superfamily domain-containing protein [Sordaria brevicollis]